MSAREFIRITNGFGENSLSGRLIMTHQKQFGASFFELSKLTRLHRRNKLYRRLYLSSLNFDHSDRTYILNYQLPIHFDDSYI
jgi:hypothetical protein